MKRILQRLFFAKATQKTKTQDERHDAYLEQRRVDARMADHEIMIATRGLSRW
jgi:hypothetical protein